MRFLAIIAVLLLLTPCSAADEWAQIVIARERQATDAQVARMYATAIAIAGACIGLGIYFGLRHQKKQESHAPKKAPVEGSSHPES